MLGVQPRMFAQFCAHRAAGGIKRGQPLGTVCEFETGDHAVPVQAGSSVFNLHNYEPFAPVSWSPGTVEPVQFIA